MTMTPEELQAWDRGYISTPELAEKWAAVIERATAGPAGRELAAHNRRAIIEGLVSF